MTETRIYNTPLKVTDQGAELGSRTIPANTVLAVVRGMSLAKEFRVAITRRSVSFNQDLKALIPKTGIDPDFLFYALYSRRAHIRDLATEASHGTKKLETEVLARLSIKVPDLRAQKCIVDLLNPYDDLIENNRRRMALLEDAGRQLYREWFVRLRFPGHEHARSVDGLPDGWERRTLGACATFHSGGTPSKGRPEYWDGDIPWVSSGELTTMRISDTQLRITAQAAEAGSRLVPPATILAVVRGMSLAKEWRIGMASRVVAFNQDLKAIIAKPGVDALYLFHSLDSQRDQVRDRAGEASHGTKKLETAVLSNLQILVPNNWMQTLFREQAGPMHAQWDNLHAQNQKLRAARDLLLPRLMSGEIAV